jgi:lysophospholipase L1-like esterase
MVFGKKHAACIGALMLAAHCASAQADTSKPEHWVSSWGTAQIVPEGPNALPAAQWRDATLRQIVHLSLGGERLRVRISNLYGTQPLLVDAASVALAVQPGSADLKPGSVRALTFSGRPNVMVPAGAEYYSDPVDLSVPRAADLAISLHFPSEPSRQTGHPGARGNNFSVAGNLVMAPKLEGAQAFTRWYQIADVEVASAPGARAIVAIGDSITDGYGVVNDTNTRWTDHFAARIARNGYANVGVVNAGIGGGRLLRDGVGTNLAARFDRDVLARSGVSHAIVLVGVNDVGVLHRNGEDTPAARQAMLDDLKDSYRQLAERAHAHSICLIVGTMPPYTASDYYRPGPENEKDRQALNTWIRSTPLFDGVADFDAALRDPAQQDRLLKAADNDGLHPSAVGYQLMADAVPLQSLKACSASPQPVTRQRQK